MADIQTKPLEAAPDVAAKPMFEFQRAAHDRHGAELHIESAPFMPKLRAEEPIAVSESAWLGTGLLVTATMLLTGLAAHFFGLGAALAGIVVGLASLLALCWWVLDSTVEFN